MSPPLRKPRDLRKGLRPTEHPVVPRDRKTHEGLQTQPEAESLQYEKCPKAKAEVRREGAVTARKKSAISKILDRSAERGMKTFPERVDSRLREFLAMEYHRRNRHDEAMALIWAEFTESPSLERYQNLKTHADRTHEWPTWREKASP